MCLLRKRQEQGSQSPNNGSPPAGGLPFLGWA